MKNKCPVVKKIKSKKERVRAFSQFLEMQYPDAVCALEYGGDPFRLLVMARLSAQCTDKRVNEVSQLLFKAFPDVFAMAEATREAVEEIIRPCGLFRTKAESIIGMSRAIIEKHGGKVPDDYNSLIALPGVGMKIANLMLGDVFHESRVVPDTHCIRITSKLALISKADPVVCERELGKILTKGEESDFCHRIVLFGREFCKAPNPFCDKCPFVHFVK